MGHRRGIFDAHVCRFLPRKSRQVAPDEPGSRSQRRYSLRAREERRVVEKVFYSGGRARAEMRPPGHPYDWDAKLATGARRAATRRPAEWSTRERVVHR